MIKFFRRIRRRLLSENKFSKYVFYAIGEIVLVVIGILIALQINNWNNENQLKSLEKKYLQELKSNLEFDLSDIQFNIDFNESRFESMNVILQFMNQEILFHDSLKFHFGNLIGTTRTLPNITAYENLKSKGMELISNDSLRREISTLYSYSYHNLIDFEKQDDHPFHYEIFVPVVSSELNIIDLWNLGEPIDQIRILKNHEFKNALTMSILYRKHMLRWYKGLRQSVAQCITHIDSELE